jgi:cobalamin biosynthesis protein CobT
LQWHDGADNDRDETCETWTDEAMTETPILDRLNDMGVVHYSLANDKTIMDVEECCEGVFMTRLTKPEAQQMISELQALVDKMVEA